MLNRSGRKHFATHSHARGINQLVIAISRGWRDSFPPAWDKLSLTALNVAAFRLIPTRVG